MSSGVLLSSLGSLGVVGFFNALTGAASLYPTDTVLKHSLLESRASVDQKPALETGGLWLHLAPGTAHRCALENLSVLPSGQGTRSRGTGGSREAASPDPLSSPTGTAAPPQSPIASPFSPWQPESDLL